MFSAIFIAFILTTLDGKAQIFPDRPTGHVNDLAGFLNPNETRSLENKLRAYRDTTSNVIAILTLDNLQGETPEYIGEQVFNTWRMWDGDRQNGILILASRQERAIRIEVGYGLEGAVPDIMAGRIIRDIIVPEFQQGNFYTALNRATTSLMQLAAGEYEAHNREGDIEFQHATRVMFILFLLVLLLIILAIKNRGPGGGHHIRRGGVVIMGTPGFGRGGFGGGYGRTGGFGGGGFGGGGFGGFSGGGGFGSGGGGATGRW